MVKKGKKSFGGRLMDNFMDKLAQRFSAQDIIAANTKAEEAEFKHMQDQIREYDECLKEMRELNLKTIEENDKLQKLTEEAVEKIQNADQIKKVAEAALAKIAEIKGEDSAPQMEALQRICDTLEESKEETKKAFDQLEESTHKECVKVFRNVQVITADEVKKQADLLSLKIDNSTETVKTSRTPIIVLLVIAIVLGAANLAASIMNLLGITVTLF